MGSSVIKAFAGSVLCNVQGTYRQVAAAGSSGMQCQEPLLCRVPCRVPHITSLNRGATLLATLLATLWDAMQLLITSPVASWLATMVLGNTAQSNKVSWQTVLATVHVGAFGNFFGTVIWLLVPVQSW